MFPNGPKWSKNWIALITRFNLVLVWSKIVLILTNKSFKCVRYNQVSWSSFYLWSALLPYCLLLCLVKKLAGGLWQWLFVLVTYDRWHVTPDTWHITGDTWHIIFFYFFFYIFKFFSTREYLMPQLWSQYAFFLFKEVIFWCLVFF